MFRRKFVLTRFTRQSPRWVLLFSFFLHATSLDAAWNITADLTSSRAADRGVAVAQGRLNATGGDSITRLYVSENSSSTSGGQSRLVEYTISAAGVVTPVTSGLPQNAVRSNPAVGAGRNDTVNRIYAAVEVGSNNVGINEYTWNGAAFTQTATVSSGLLSSSGSFPDVHLTLGDGRNDDQIRLYAAFNQNTGGGLQNCVVKEFLFSGTWSENPNNFNTGNVTGPVAIGEGRNDGVSRIYYHVQNTGTGVNLAEATFSGGTWSTANITNFVQGGNDNTCSSVGTGQGLKIGGQGAAPIVITQARGDGVNRIYAGRAEATFSGGAWSVARIINPKPGSGECNAISTDFIFAVGNGRNDGSTRLYAFGTLGTATQGSSPGTSSTVATNHFISEWSLSSGNWTKTDILQTVFTSRIGNNSRSYLGTLGNGRNDDVNRLYEGFLSPTLDESLQSGGTTTEQATVIEMTHSAATSFARTLNASSPATVMRVDVPSGGTAEVFFPAAPYPSNVTVTVDSNVTIPPGAVSGATPLGVGFNVDQSPTTTAFSSGKQPVVAVTYSEAVARDYFPKEFFIGRFASGQWSPTGTGCCRQGGSGSSFNQNHTQRDLTNRRINASGVQGFSTFQIFSSPDVDNILGAGGGRTADGAFGYPSPFSTSLASEMKFVKLGAGEKIRIYGVGNVFVKELSANANGVANWDVKDDGGSPLAPGVYIVRPENGSPFNIAVFP